MKLALARAWSVVERQLVGAMPPDVRATMHIDMQGAAVQSVLIAIVLFMPALLRRQGASSEQVALYHSLTYLGLLSTSLSVALMRRWGMRRVAIGCWVIGRSFFFFGALASNSVGLMAIGALYFLFENWPGPAYVQTIQTVYPVQYRARIMAAVRLCFAVCMLAFNPLAGWMLDHLGYRVLLPLAALAGLASARMLARLTARAGAALHLPPPTAEARPSVGHILRTDRRYAFFLLSVVLFGFAGLMPVALYPVVQVSRLELSYTEIGLLGLAQSFTWMLSYLFGGRLTERFGGARCFQITCVIHCVVMLPYAWATQGWMLLPSFVAAGIASAGIDLWLNYTILELADPARLPDYTALCSTVIGARGLLAPFVGAGLLRAGLSPTGLFILGATLTLLAALALRPVVKTALRPVPSAASSG